MGATLGAVVLAGGCSDDGGVDDPADALAERVAGLRPDWWTVRCRLGGPWPDA